MLQKALNVLLPMLFFKYLKFEISKIKRKRGRSQSSKPQIYVFGFGAPPVNSYKL